MNKEKDVTRREFLGLAAAAAMAALLPGCGNAQLAEVSPGTARRAARGRAYASVHGQTYAPAPAVSAPQYVIVQQQPAAVPAGYVPAPPPQPLQRRPAPVPSATPSPGKVRAVSRQSWATVAAVPEKMKPMNGVTRITVHHEGSKANADATPAAVAATLRRIQGQHKKRMSAGDIGYHFIIDRAGTIWQGRDAAYQGAHASGANAHNIGVMLLGNFEIQQTTQSQLAAMRNLVHSLARLHGLNLRTDIYAHNDFGNTQCPGKNLKPHVKAFSQL